MNKLFSNSFALRNRSAQSGIFAQRRLYTNGVSSSAGSETKSVLSFFDPKLFWRSDKGLGIFRAENDISNVKEYYCYLPQNFKLQINTISASIKPKLSKMQVIVNTTREDDASLIVSHYELHTHLKHGQFHTSIVERKVPTTEEDTDPTEHIPSNIRITDDPLVAEDSGKSQQNITLPQVDVIIDITKDIALDIDTESGDIILQGDLGGHFLRIKTGGTPDNIVRVAGTIQDSCHVAQIETTGSNIKVSRNEALQAKFISEEGYVNIGYAKETDMTIRTNREVKAAIADSSLNAKSAQGNVEVKVAYKTKDISVEAPQGSAWVFVPPAINPSALDLSSDNSTPVVGETLNFRQESVGKNAVRGLLINRNNREPNPKPTASINARAANEVHVDILTNPSKN